ncbi:MAG: sulfotransferase family protein, partial [Gammaproteobacteria bacterium]
PIFIVGLPRSGSTLVEQILASHPLVEGTAELPDIGRICSEISRRYPDPRYPDAVLQMEPGEFRELGTMYLERTRRMRSGKPFFTDKMPNNFASVGLIRLILPQARIVDARRHPLDSCLGCFKQHFALGQSFTYDLDDLADFYLGYRSLMQHWHEVLPGQVLDFRLEQLIREQEGQTHRLLDHCGLPWDDACLDFHRTARAVRTASSEQVRQPLYDSSVDYWRHFREQLSPLLDALGPAILADGWAL